MAWRETLKRLKLTRDDNVGPVGEELAVEELGCVKPVQRQDGYDVIWNGLRVEVKTKRLNQGRALSGHYFTISAHNKKNADEYLICVIPPDYAEPAVYRVPGKAVHEAASRNANCHVYLTAIPLRDQVFVPSLE